MPVYSYKFSGREVLAANAGSITVPGNAAFSGSLLHGFQIVNNGSYNHLQGGYVQAGTTKAYYSDENSGNIINLAAGVDATSQFPPNSIALLDDEPFENSIGRTCYLVLSSSYSNPYTTIWLDGDASTSQLYIIGSGKPQNGFTGGGSSITAIAAHAEGYTNYAVGNYSHAEGLLSTALGDYSHAEGQSTVAGNIAAHAEGYQTRAYAAYSHTEGLGTITKANYQTAVGQYNATSSVQSSFMIGNGTSNTARRTLFQTSGSTVQITGSLNIAGSSIITGSLTVGSSSPGPAENTLTLGARDTGGEGGQIGFNAPGGTYTSASYIDNYQNQFRILKGNNTTSISGLMVIDMTTNQTQFLGAVTASAYSGLPNAYLYAYRSGTNQTITGDWANKDIIFNSTGANNNISYNTGTGIATLKANKVYRITATVAWLAASGYVLQHRIYNQTTSEFVGPIAEVGQPNSTSWNGSTGVLEYIFAVGSSDQNISIRTTSSTNGLPGESIRHDLNTVLIIQQIA